MTDFTLDELATKIADRIRPSIPIEIALWDVSDIGAYLKRSPQTVRERIVCLPDFPKPIRTPALREGKVTRGHPAWKAMEVIKWTESHREQPQGRPRKH